VNEVAGDIAMTFGNARLLKTANHANGKHHLRQPIVRLADRAVATDLLLVNQKANDRVPENPAWLRNFVTFQLGKKRSRACR
jgi:hypothetical protein